MTRIMDRMGELIGLWRGTIALQDGRKGISEFRFTPYFEGNLIELFAGSVDAKTGESQVWGMAHIATDRAGRIVWRQFNQRVGFATLYEVDDEPGRIAVSGLLAGGRKLTVSILSEGDEIALDMSSGAPDGSRTVTRMRRVGPVMKEPR